MRPIALAIFLLLTAISGSQITTPAARTTVRKGIMDGIRPTVAQDVGTAVELKVISLRVYKGWAFTTVTPLTPSGGQINWTKTKYRTDYNTAGFGGCWIALLKQHGKTWKVVHSWGALVTDVEWIDYPQKYGLPKALFGLT